MLNNILYDLVYHSVPIILAVLGGIFAHKVNVLNIGLEGMMLMGAFSSALSVYITGNLWLGILIGVILTLIIGLIFCLFSITLKSNFIITGLGINLFVSMLSSFILKAMGLANINVSNVVNVADLKIHIPFIENIPILGPLLSGHTIITYFSFLMIILASVLMFKTKFGVYVRVVGENEEAAKSVGINVNKIKYISILIGALLCAFAGANLSVERMALFTPDMTAGRGFIAIAAIFCGRGLPLRSTAYALVFGLARSLAINLALFAGPVSGLLEMVPYLMIVIVLAIASGVESKKTKIRGFKWE
ncbi:MAG: ABC transporter permease [Oscillospiraceae bacterium]